MTRLTLTKTEKKVLDALQGDLPDGGEPFDLCAERAGLAVEEFIQIARGLLRGGVLRKVCALVNHVQAGFQANAMCVWNVPAERVDEAGQLMAGFDEVTHCYRRQVSDEWPYALFSMVHGRSREQCAEVARRIARAVDPLDYRIIYSTRELKKRSLRLPLGPARAADRRNGLCP